MNYSRPIVLSVAGFDPTGGAGVLADAKTFESHRVLGFCALTSVTVQTELEVKKINWLETDSILEQLEPLFLNYTISVCKIGIIENLKTLLDVCYFIKNKQPQCKIVWDPILAASSGFVLHESINKSLLNQVLDTIDLITPNVNEAQSLLGSEYEVEAAFELGERCSVLLKGGHSLLRPGVDVLIEDGLLREIEIIHQERQISPKHGSGCILSAAISANLALGLSLYESCKVSKSYTEMCLISNPKLLSYHVI